MVWHHYISRNYLVIVHVHVRHALPIKNFWQFRSQDLKHTEIGPFPLLHLNSGTSCQTSAEQSWACLSHCVKISNQGRAIVYKPSWKIYKNIFFFSNKSNKCLFLVMVERLFHIPLCTRLRTPACFDHLKSTGT